MIKQSVEEVRQLYASCMNESEVARVLGFSRQSMYDYRIRHGIPYNPAKAKKKTHDIFYGERNARIKDDYLNDMSIEEICKKYKTGRGDLLKKPALNYILTKLGIKHPAIHPSRERNMQIMEMRKEKIPVKEIAEKFGLKPIYVSSIIYKIKSDAKKKK